MEQNILRKTQTNPRGDMQSQLRPVMQEIQTAPQVNMERRRQDMQGIQTRRRQPVPQEISVQHRHQALQEIPIHRRRQEPEDLQARRSRNHPQDCQAQSTQQAPQYARTQRYTQATQEAQTRRRQAQQRKKRRHMLWVTTKTVVILLLFAVAGYKGWEYWNSMQKTDPTEQDGITAFASPSSPSPAGEKPAMNNAASLPEGADYMEYLHELAESNPQIKEILSNQEQYPDKLLEMLAKNPETLDFVSNYPEEKNKEHKIKISDTYVKGEIPLYIQWDSQWGYDNYGDGMIALDGCGPTCLSMVYIGLTGDTSMNPREMADYSSRNGYLTSSGATTWDLMLSGASGLGLSSWEVSLDETVIRRELEAGHPIICSMRPGDFTTTGHFIVLTGIADDGSIIVNDPNSILRSQQTWELDRLMRQMKNLWSFSK